MSESFRRFEILLPRQFNNGQAVPDELVAETLRELEDQFGAVSCETQIIRGLWRHADEIFRDDLVKVYVDTADSAESRDFFIQFKQLLKSRFRQLDIWMTTYPIEVL